MDACQVKERTIWSLIANGNAPRSHGVVRSHFEKSIMCMPWE